LSQERQTFASCGYHFVEVSLGHCTHLRSLRTSSLRLVISTRASGGHRRRGNLISGHSAKLVPFSPKATTCKVQPQAQLAPALAYQCSSTDADDRVRPPQTACARPDRGRPAEGTVLQRKALGRAPGEPTIRGETHRKRTDARMDRQWEDSPRASFQGRPSMDRWREELLEAESHDIPAQPSHSPRSLRTMAALGNRKSPSLNDPPDEGPSTSQPLPAPEPSSPMDGSIEGVGGNAASCAAPITPDPGSADQPGLALRQRQGVHVAFNSPVTETAPEGNEETAGPARHDRRHHRKGKQRARPHPLVHPTFHRPPVPWPDGARIPDGERLVFPPFTVRQLKTHRWKWACIGCLCWLIVSFVFIMVFVALMLSAHEKGKHRAAVSGAHRSWRGVQQPGRTTHFTARREYCT
jgi:hypothetical protein